MIVRAGVLGWVFFPEKPCRNRRAICNMMARYPSFYARDRDRADRALTCNLFSEAPL